jgi:hypothetical protein
MTRAGRMLARLERRPWTLAAVSAVGLTLLVPSVLALYGPPELLDSAVALGNVKLVFGLAALFVVSWGGLRIALRRRRLREEEVDEEPPPERVPHGPSHEPLTNGAAHLR